MHDPAFLLLDSLIPAYRDCARLAQNGEGSESALGPPTRIAALASLSPSPQTASTIVDPDDREAGRIGLIAAMPLGSHLLSSGPQMGNQPTGVSAGGGVL